MNRKRIASVAVASLVLGGISLLEASGCNLIVDSGGYQVVAGDATAPQPDGAPAVDAGPGLDTSLPPVDSAADTTPPVIDSAADDVNVADTNLPDTSPPACGSSLPTASTDFVQLVKSCVLDQGCQLSSYGTSVGSCIADGALFAISGASKCETGATDCNYVANCSGSGFSINGECDGGSNSVYCDGQNRAQHCTDKSITGSSGNYDDCTKNGGTCRTYVDKTNPDAGEQVGCAVVSSCTNPDDGNLYCSGASNDLYQCIHSSDAGNIGIGIGCNAYQATCEDGGNGTSCYYTLPACDPAATPHCDGNTGQICYTTGLQRYNCATAGLTCVDRADPVTGLPFSCVAPGCDAPDGGLACTESCTGKVASFCVGGAPVTFDCASVGMSCYLSATNDQNGNSLVFCLPY